MNRVGLTPQQSAVYKFLKLYYNEMGYYPTQRESAVGKISGEQIIPMRRSPSTIHRIMGILQKKGWIEKVPGNARALKVS